MPFGPLIPVVILLMIMLQGCTPKRKNNNKNKQKYIQKKNVQMP